MYENIDLKTILYAFNQLSWKQIILSKI